MRASQTVSFAERGCVHLDADGFDEGALHVFAHGHMTRALPVLASARIRPGDKERQEVVIDKVLTSPARRRDGTADALFERPVRALDARWSGHVARAIASPRAGPCCERFGFRMTRATCDDGGGPCAVWT